MREGGYSGQKEYFQKEKYLVNYMRAYILVSSVIDRKTWLHDLVRLAVSYLSYIPF